MFFVCLLHVGDCSSRTTNTEIKMIVVAKSAFHCHVCVDIAGYLQPCSATAAPLLDISLIAVSQLWLPYAGTIMMYLGKDFGRSAAAPDLQSDMSERSARHYLIDEISGYEHGRHLDHESFVMILIGKRAVHCISFDLDTTMFRWHETLRRLIEVLDYHVTLQSVTETSGLSAKIYSGLQGNLHVQPRRLCLIGEPADGNKFICEWPQESLVSLDVHETNSKNCRLLRLRANSKAPKAKGFFEFEISFKSVIQFKKTFDTFLLNCQGVNKEFRSNFINKRLSMDLSRQDKSYFSYTISSKEFNCSNSEHNSSSSVEKRSCEIPIPRSREHSGPEQRPLDEVRQMSNKKKLASLLDSVDGGVVPTVVETRGSSAGLLFTADEELQGEEDISVSSCMHIMNPHQPMMLYSAASQESSGVYVQCSPPVSGSAVAAAGACKPVLHATLSLSGLHEDSGCANLAHGSSTGSSCECQPPSFSGGLLSFYQDVVARPLLLANYEAYMRWLSSSPSSSCMVGRSSSFNCCLESVSGAVSVIGATSKKTSTNGVGDAGLPYRKQHSSITPPFLYESIKRRLELYRRQRQISSSSKPPLQPPSLQTPPRAVADQSSTKLNSSPPQQKQLLVGEDSRAALLQGQNLPFDSVEHMHGAVVQAARAGSVCHYLFRYDQFLRLLADVRALQGLLASAATRLDPSDKAALRTDWMAQMANSHKYEVPFLSAIYSAHATNPISSSTSTQTNSRYGLLHDNLRLVFDIISCLVSKTRHTNSPDLLSPTPYCCHCYYPCCATSVSDPGRATSASAPTAAASSSAADTALLPPPVPGPTSTTLPRHQSPRPSQSPIPEGMPLPAMHHHQRCPSLGGASVASSSGYQNLALHTAHNTFPKQHSSSSTSKSVVAPTSSDVAGKGGSFKKMRRKGPPTLLAPFMQMSISRHSQNFGFTRRKTLSIHSTVSEPTSSSTHSLTTSHGNQLPLQACGSGSHSSYYNMVGCMSVAAANTTSEAAVTASSHHQQQRCTKRSLSVLLDSSQYPHHNHPHQQHQLCSPSSASSHLPSSANTGIGLETVSRSNYINMEQELDNLAYGGSGGVGGGIDCLYCSDYGGGLLGDDTDMCDDIDDGVGGASRGVPVAYPEEMLDPSRNYGPLLYGAATGGSGAQRSYSSRVRLWCQDSSSGASSGASVGVNSGLSHSDPHQQQQRRASLTSVLSQPPYSCHLTGSSLNYVTVTPGRPPNRPPIASQPQTNQQGGHVDYCRIDYQRTNALRDVDSALDEHYASLSKQKNSSKKHPPLRRIFNRKSEDRQ